MSTVVVHPTAEQVARWRQVGGADLSAYVLKAADFYYTRLQIRREKAQRLRAEGLL